MPLVEILLIAFSLSLDAFVVAIGIGALGKIKYSRALFVACVLGIFHTAMPAFGWFVGLQFSSYLAQYGHIIGFALLLFVGLKMFRESFDTEKDVQRHLSKNSTLMVLAFATSIDALVMGVSFSFMNVSIIQAVGAIGGITLLMALLGVYLGHRTKHLFGARIELLGALIIIGLAFKVLLF